MSSSIHGYRALELIERANLAAIQLAQKVADKLEIKNPGNAEKIEELLEKALKLIGVSFSKVINIKYGITADAAINRVKTAEANYIAATAQVAADLTAVQEAAEPLSLLYSTFLNSLTIQQRTDFNNDPSLGLSINTAIAQLTDPNISTSTKLADLRAAQLSLILFANDNGVSVGAGSPLGDLDLAFQTVATSLTTLEADEAALVSAQTERDAAVGFFMSISSLELAIFKELYPDVLNPYL